MLTLCQRESYAIVLIRQIYKKLNNYELYNVNKLMPNTN